MDDLRKALETYGTHLPSCPRWISFGSGQPCRCGFHDVLGKLCPNCEAHGSYSRAVEKLMSENDMTKEDAQRFITELKEFENL